tara:strand:- start:9978 stop:10415 length:438 start_codon:yes stop_codon:yes gene_type:complete
MKLYYNSKGQWAGNQDDAKAFGLPFEQCDVPYDKKGLLEFLNENAVKSTNASAGNIDPVIIKSGNTISTPLSYVKDEVGVTEIQNIYDNLRSLYVTSEMAFKAASHIMSKLGHISDQTELLKDECFEEIDNYLKMNAKIDGDKNE